MIYFHCIVGLICCICVILINILLLFSPIILYNKESSVDNKTDSPVHAIYSSDLEVGPCGRLAYCC